MPTLLAPRPRSPLLASSCLVGLLALLAGALACDPPAPDTAANAAAQPAAAQPEAAKGPAYDECLAACSEAKSADDKATCRLNCRSSEGLDRRKVGAAAGPARTSFHALHACRDACTSPDDLAGCANACVAQAARGEPAVSLLPAGKAEALQACAETCLGQVMNCSVECAGPEAAKSADDRATCRMQCDALGATCLGNCGS